MALRYFRQGLGNPGVEPQRGGGATKPTGVELLKEGRHLAEGGRDLVLNGQVYADRGFAFQWVGLCR